MPLPNYTPERRREVAQHLGIDEQYVYQVLKQIKVASPSLASRWHQYDAAATLQDLRPKDWQEIWPELVTGETAPVIAADLPIDRSKLVELIDAGLVKDERQITRRAADRTNKQAV